MSRLHILSIASSRLLAPDDPIAGAFEWDQVRALARAGFKVGVLAPKPRNLRTLKSGRVESATSKHAARIDGVPVFRFPGFVWIPERVPYLFGKAFERIGKDLYRQYVTEYGAPDVLHAHNALYAGSLAAALKRPEGIPSVLTEHSSAYLREGRHRAWQGGIARRAVYAADAHVGVSPALCRALTLEYPMREGRWEWIPNVLSPIFEDQDDEIPAPGGEETFRFLAVGSLKQVKDHRRLISAFAQAFGGDAGVSLRIGGEGPLRSELEEQIQRLGVSEQVRLLGGLSRERVLSEMRSCDAFVLSSSTETFGVVLIEALSCGRPVVATACGGPEEIVDEADGLLVHAPGVESLADGLRSLKSTIRAYDAKGIRERCLRRFGGAAVAERLRAVYERVLDDPGASGGTRRG